MNIRYAYRHLAAAGASVLATRWFPVDYRHRGLGLTHGEYVEYFAECVRQVGLSWP